MKRKTKIKVFSFALTFLLGLTAILFLVNAGQNVYAEEITNDQPYEFEKIDFIANDETNPLGVFTSLSLTIDVEYGLVFATVRNDVTIFPSKVRVYVRLYSSTTYQESYQTMTLENENYTEDLNMGSSLKAYAPINGVKRYWQARIYYKVDSAAWAEKLTSVWLIDVDGTATKA